MTTPSQKDKEKAKISLKDFCIVPESTNQALHDSFAQALADERERCAKIVETKFPYIDPYVAAAIRKGVS